MELFPKTREEINESIRVRREFLYVRRWTSISCNYFSSFFSLSRLWRPIKDFTRLRDYVFQGFSNKVRRRRRFYRVSPGYRRFAGSGKGKLFGASVYDSPVLRRVRGVDVEWGGDEWNINLRLSKIINLSWVVTSVITIRGCFRGMY